jgi:hypothetical protein
MSAASGCYLNFILVGIYLTKNNFNSKNYVFNRNSYVLRVTNIEGYFLYIVSHFIIN